MSSVSDLVSVVLPFRDAEATLADQLEALAAQDAGTPWELIAVDGGSADRSALIIERFRHRLPHVVVVSEVAVANAAAARNAGVQQASGDRLLFCDADDIVGGGWLAALGDALRHHPVAAGRFEWERLNPPWLRRTRDLPQTSGLQEWAGFLPFAGGGNLAARREVLEATGGFDETFDWLEDTDFCFRAQLEGYQLALAPAALVHVRLRDDPRGVFAQGRGYGQGTVALHRRFRPQGMPARNPLWGAAGWLAIPFRLGKAWNSAGYLRWLHRVGWKVGLLQGSVKHRMLVL